MPPVRELPPRILIVRLGAIGDVANALVVAAALKEHRPEVEIGWVVHDLARPLVEDNPCVDFVHWWRRGVGLRGLRRVLREIRARNYGLAIDLQRIFKSGLVARRSGAPRTLGFDRRRAKELSWLWQTDTIPPADPGAHMVTQYMEFVTALGIEGADATHVLPVDAAAEAWAEEQVTRAGAAPVLVNLGASKPENRWPAERFGALAQRVVERFASPVFLCGGPVDRESAASALGAVHDEESIHDFVGHTSLGQLIALERRARLFIGCDTGPMHLAVAVGTPVVALFGPAEPRRTGPWGAGHRVVRDPSHAMDALHVEAVLAAAAELLAP